MADPGSKENPDLGSMGVLDGDELIHGVDDPAGTPESGSTTPAAITTYVTGNLDPITLDPGNDRVGINDAAPDEELVVTGASGAVEVSIEAAGATNVQLDLENSAANWRLQNRTTGVLRLREADVGVDAFQVATTGDITMLQDLTSSGGRYQNKTRITSFPYSVVDSDHNILANTDAGGGAVNLQAGVDERYLRIVNTGTSGNAVSVTPDGSENLMGANSAFALADGEALIIIFDSTDGWY